jgi:hypothetical protein
MVSVRPADCATATIAAPPCRTRAAATGGAAPTGILVHTRFVKPPIIVRFLETKPDPHFAGYTIYFRLNRDLPRDPAGGRNALFDPFADSSDPVLGLLAHSGHRCFTQDVSTDPIDSGLPIRRGGVFHLVLRAHDRRHRRGTLPATVRLRVQQPRAANDYRPYRYPKELGC